MLFKKVKTRFKTNNTETEIVDIKYITKNGIKYIVVPTIMVQAQVLNGEYLPASEIEKSTPGWNGRPVVVYHPSNKQGEDVSANSPDVLIENQIGSVYNSVYDSETTKLKAELWLDISKINEIGGSAIAALNNIKNGIPLDVSTGYFREVEEVSGNSNGQKYDGIQHNILPDHLALLPGETGACSFEDGCGVRNNKQANKQINKQKGGNKLKIKKQIKLLQKALLVNKDRIEFVLNELGVTELFEKIRSSVVEQFGFEDAYIVDILPETNTVIFETWDAEGNYQTYKVSYTVSDSEVSLGTDYSEVVKKVSYEAEGETAEAGTTETVEEAETGDEEVTTEEAEEEVDEEVDEEAEVEDNAEEEENPDEEVDAENAEETVDETEGKEEDEETKNNAFKERIIQAILGTNKKIYNNSHKAVFRKMSTCDLIKLLPAEQKKQFAKNCSEKDEVEKSIASISNEVVRKQVMNAYKIVKNKREIQIEKISKVLKLNKNNLVNVPDCVLDRIEKSIKANTNKNDSSAVDYTGKVNHAETKIFKDSDNTIPLAVNIFDKDRNKDKNEKKGGN